MRTDYGVPEWGCYGIFALFTIAVGLLLGLVSSEGGFILASSKNQVNTCADDTTILGHTARLVSLDGPISNGPHDLPLRWSDY